MTTRTMRAAKLYAPGDLRVEEVPVPTLGAGDVLVKVLSSGVCGSDIPRILTQGTYHFPTIPGHEFAGAVAEIGTGVTRVKKDDRVTAIPLLPCKQCRFCEIGQFAQCEKYGFLGSRDDGGFAEYARVPAENLVLVSAAVDDDAAAMLEPISVALHVVTNTGVNWGDTVAVFGLGAIGNFVAQWAKAFGAKRVFAIDVQPEKVAIAKKVGLSDAICGAQTDVVAYLRQETGGLGVDVAFEAAGSGAAFAQAVAAVRSFGRFGLVGRPGQDMVVKDATLEKILRGQLTLKGTWSFEFTHFPHHAWEQGILALSQGAIQVEPLITHRFPLEQTLAAVKLLATRQQFAGKIMIKPQHRAA